MFTKALYPDTLRGLISVGKVPFLSQCYLAGGTALALYLGHRISVDLDFFTDQKFNEQEIAGELVKLPDFKLDGTPPGTILGRIGEDTVT